MGDLIGRSEKAELCIDDPRVSEAHALVSLRGEALMLLALRGRFRVDGKVVSEVTLREGLAVELYEGFWLCCDEIVVPECLPGVIVPGLGRVTLSHTSSLFLDRSVGAHEVRPGYVAGADVVFWPLGSAWSYRVSGGRARALETGAVFNVSGVEIRCEEVPLRDAAVPQTRQTARAPLGLHVHVRSVTVRRGGAPAVVITGVPGKILASAASCARPQGWEEVASRVWPGEAGVARSFRHRFDVGMLRLREKLGHLGLPTDLVRMDGSGMVLLALSSDDTVTFTHPDDAST